jgi:U3 small nucleolar RNA-associated protein 14
MAKSKRPAGPSHNAKGYAKRHERKQKKSSSNDVYEYTPEKFRRANVAMRLDREEVEGFLGSDDDDDRPRQARLIGENSDNERIGSDDDEEIDSDAAFEESDEERYAGFFSSKVCLICPDSLHTFDSPFQKKASSSKPKSKVRFADVDLNEDDELGETNASDASNESEEGEEEGEPDEFIDVLDILDGRGEPYLASDNDEDNNPSKSSTPKLRAMTEDSDMDEDGDGSGSEEEEEDDDDEDAFAPSDDDVHPPEALDQLQTFISTLDSSALKRKQPPDNDNASVQPETRPAKRRMLKERNEAGVEDEFRAHDPSMLLNIFIDFSANTEFYPRCQNNPRRSPRSPQRSKYVPVPVPQGFRQNTRLFI